MCIRDRVSIVQGLVFIVFLGLVAITVIIYQGVIQSGTSTGPVTGIALSLLPSAIIAILGVAVKWKVLSDEDEENPNQQESFLSRATSLFRNNIPTKEPSTEGQKDNILSKDIHLPISNGSPKKRIAKAVKSDTSGVNLDRDDGTESGQFENPTSEVFVNNNAGECVVTIDLGASDKEGIQV